MSEPGLFESGTFTGGDRTFPNGCHVEAEIDETTGAVAIVRHHAVEDVGHMINPLLVAGQLHGGIAQASARRCWRTSSTTPPASSSPARSWEAF